MQFGGLIKLSIYDMSVFGIVFKIILIAIIFTIILQALRIISKDVKRAGKGNQNLDWKLKLEYPGDGGSFVQGDLISIGNRVLIGRNTTNHVVLPSQSVSNFHAKIYFEDGRYMIEDLKSTNGTFVNGIQIDKKSLQPGDEIGISQTLFIVMDD